VQLNVYEAKTQLSKLLDRAVAGETIVIARAGEPLEPQRRCVWRTARREDQVAPGLLRAHDRRRSARSRPVKLLLDTHCLIWLLDDSRSA
jgi:antitoxin (DNA-binding transcriptional repressor) of toxin-antitoxin stability system